MLQVEERQARLLALPKELLLAIYESQTSLIEVSRLSQTCRLLHQISRNHARSIADAIENPSPISLDEALCLAKAQYIYETRGNGKAMEVAQFELLASRVVANDMSSICLISDDALRLAQAQLVFTAPESNRYCPRDGETGRHFIERRLAEARLTKPSKGPFNLFAVRHRASLNTPDAARVLVLLAMDGLSRARRSLTVCEVHPRDSLLPHEKRRALSTWYFFKLYVLSYNLPRDGSLRCDLDAEFRDMSAVRLCCLLDMRRTLCDDVFDDVMEALGIQDPSPDNLDSGITRHPLYEDWEDLFENICKYCQRAREIDEEGYDEADMSIVGCCDICEGNCKPREQGKGLWDL